MNSITRATTDREIILTWLASKSNTTQTNYGSIIKQFIEFVDRPLSDLTLEDLQLWLKRLQLTFEPSTVANKVLTIKSLLSFCYATGYLNQNIGAFLKTPKFKDKLASRILLVQDIKKLINAASCDRDCLMLSLMYGCGLRVSEVCSLTWGDFQPHGKDGKCTVFGKGAKTRIVIIPQRLWTRLMRFSETASSKAVFISFVTGRPLERSRVHQIIKECALLAGVNPKASTHWLRHSHASHAIEAGCNLRLLQQSLGHSKLETTEKYLHVNPDAGSSQFIDL